MNPSTNSTPQLRLALRPDEAARALGIGTRKLWELSHETGAIRAIKVGRATLYRVADLEAFLERQAAVAEEGEE